MAAALPIRRPISRHPVGHDSAALEPRSNARVDHDRAPRWVTLRAPLKQLMAALPSDWKMPFEIGAPSTVRRITRCQAVRVGFASTHSPALSRHQAPFAKYLADRARHRQRNPRMVPFKNHEQLTWPQIGVLLTRSHHELGSSKKCYVNCPRFGSCPRASRFAAVTSSSPARVGSG